MVRVYKESDISFVEANDFIASLQIRYYGDVDKSNCFTAEDEEGKIRGVLYFTYHDSWYSTVEKTSKLVVNIVVEEQCEEVERELVEYAKQRYRIIKEKNKNRNVRLVIWCDDTEKDRIQRYMNCGVVEVMPCPCLVFDLKKPIPKYDVLVGMRIEELLFTSKDIQQYIEATRLGNDGTANSEAQVWFMSSGGKFKIYVIKDGEQIVSTASYWEITEERAAMENVCTIPAYRNKNLARAIISYVLQQEKDMGYKEATLSMLGSNKRALQLYQSLGFEFLYNQIEMNYFE